LLHTTVRFRVTTAGPSKEPSRGKWTGWDSNPGNPVGVLPPTGACPRSRLIRNSELGSQAMSLLARRTGVRGPWSPVVRLEARSTKVTSCPVEAAGFEPATSCLRSRRTAGLCFAPRSGRGWEVAVTFGIAPIGSVQLMQSQLLSVEHAPRWTWGHSWPGDRSSSPDRSYPHLFGG